MTTTVPNVTLNSDAEMGANRSTLWEPLRQESRRGCRAWLACIGHIIPHSLGASQ